MSMKPTARTNNSDPRPQNIPIHTELGAEIHRAFVADAEPLAVIDFSGLELRIVDALKQGRNDSR